MDTTAFNHDLNDNIDDAANPLEAVARPVAPEDIRVGDFIAPLHDRDQFFVRACEPAFAAEPQRPVMHVVTIRSFCSCPRLFRVLAVALPLILVEDHDGDRSLLTIRAHEFARLPQPLGEIAMRDLDRRRKEEAAQRRASARRRRDPLSQGANGAD